MLYRHNIIPLAVLGVLLPLAYGTAFWADRSQQETGSDKCITVFAAAGATNVVTELARRYETCRGIPIQLNLASSSTLARQIEAGGPAEVFVSANAHWIDYLEGVDALIEGTRCELVANRLVLIAPKGDAFRVKMAPEFDVAGAFGGCIALADPDHAPAGMYAREALEQLGWYSALAPRIAPCQNVRMALAAVEIKEAAAGIIYATDAMASQKVDVVAEFPAELHTPIRFSAALCNGASQEAAEFLQYLSSPEAAGVFRQYGFLPLTARPARQSSRSNP
jgi:molybdate transport system substrate-binding protein